MLNLERHPKSLNETPDLSPTKHGLQITEDQTVIKKFQN